MLIKALNRTFTEAICSLSSDPNGLRVISLQNPEKRNALSRLLISQLQDHLKTIAKDQEARVMVLRSTVDNIFCAGADLKERAGMAKEDVAEFVWGLRNSFNMIEDLPIPTIACVDGFALGGGLEMALACDLRYAGLKAKVGLVETKIAVIPGAGGTFRLPKVVGIQRAKEMVFTAKVIDAKIAKEYGIFCDVVEDVYGKCVEVAGEIMKNGPIAVKMAKKSIDLGYAKERSTGMQVEALCYAGIVDTEDRVEALMAFKEKRSPVFKGK